jgi:uncharacterized OB-fold protein
VRDPVRPIREGLFVTGEDGLRLVTGSCDRCGEPHFPRTDSCPYCGSDAISERRLGPDGVVALSTVVRRPPPGYTGPVPYGFGVVRLAGTRLEIVSRIAARDLDAVGPGAPVRLALEEVPADDGPPAAVWTFRVVET